MDAAHRPGEPDAGRQLAWLIDLGDGAADETAKVEFSDGSSAEYDVVVGADGRRSSVRVMAAMSVSGKVTVSSGWPSVKWCTSAP